MRSNGGLYFLTLLAMLAQSHAALGSVSDGDYGVDPPLFSSDDLSGFNFFTDPDIVGDNSAIGDLSTNDDTTPLFADNIDDCSSNDALQPSSKIRARDNQLCPSGLGSNNPAVRIPNVDDLDNLVNPNPDSSKPEKVWHKGLGYYSICPSRSKKPADWVVCGIQGGSHGQATWEFDVYDAELWNKFAKFDDPEQIFSALQNVSPHGKYGAARCFMPKNERHHFVNCIRI